MVDVLPSQLMHSVMGKLYDVLTNGDETVPSSEDNFFTWATPGIPVEVEDFDFLSQGLTGVVKRKAIDDLQATGADDDSPDVELTPELLDQLRAEDTAKLYMQAENLARLVDFVPDVTQAENGQFARLNVLNNEGGLSDIYRYILRMSQVAETELSDELKAKIAELRGLLQVTKTKKNLIDGSETKVTEPSEVTRAYFEKMAAFEAAALEYNTARIDAMTASNPRAVHYFALNANVLRNKVRAALSDWVSNGYKNDYEDIAAFLDQVMQRDMSLLKQEYRDDLEKARITGLASGSDFFYTSLIPGNFARSSGWTRFSFSKGDFSSQHSSKFSTSRWEARGGGTLFGLFSGAGGGGRSESRSEYSGSFNTSNFSLSFEIAQVPIARPWLKQAFLLSRSWRFDQNIPEAKDEVVSDGGAPPKGLIPAYPTSVVFIRNLRMHFGESSGLETFMSEATGSHASGGGFVTWGPVALGGSYSRSGTSGSTERTHSYQFSNQGLEVPGMQVVGFKCHILPKSPNPLPSITDWV